MNIRYHHNEHHASSDNFNFLSYNQLGLDITGEKE